MLIVLLLLELVYFLHFNVEHHRVSAFNRQKVVGTECVEELLVKVEGIEACSLK